MQAHTQMHTRRLLSWLSAFLFITTFSVNVAAQAESREFAAHLISGTIEIRVVGARNEYHHGGRLSLRVVDSEGQDRKLTIDFKDKKFSLELLARDQIVTLSSLELSGVRSNFDCERFWFSRDELLEKGLHLQLRVGREIRWDVIDAVTNEPINDFEVYFGEPSFYRNQNGSHATQRPALVGGSPIVWRLPPRLNVKLYVSAPGHELKAVSADDVRIELARSGELQLVFPSEWESCGPLVDSLELHYSHSYSDDRWITLSQWLSPGSDLLVLDRLPEGTFQVELFPTDKPLLCSREVEVRAGEVSTMGFEAAFKRLKKGGGPLKFIIELPEIMVGPELELNFSDLFPRSLEPGIFDDEVNHSRTSEFRTGLHSNGSPTFEFDFVFFGDYQFYALERVFRIQHREGAPEAQIIHFPAVEAWELQVMDHYDRVLGETDLTVRCWPFANAHFDAEKRCFYVHSAATRICVQQKRSDGSVFHETDIPEDFFFEGKCRVLKVQGLYYLDLVVDDSLLRKDPNYVDWWEHTAAWTLTTLPGKFTICPESEEIEGGKRFIFEWPDKYCLTFHEDLEIDGPRVRIIEVGPEGNPRVEIRILKFNAPGEE